MIGEDQMGLSECINSVLHSFSADIQTDLVNVSRGHKFPGAMEVTG